MLFVFCSSITSATVTGTVLLHSATSHRRGSGLVGDMPPNFTFFLSWSREKWGDGAPICLDMSFSCTGSLPATFVTTDLRRLICGVDIEGRRLSDGLLRIIEPFRSGSVGSTRMNTLNASNDMRPS